MPAVASASRLLGYVCILAVDDLEDSARAGTVAVLVHGDFTGNAGEVLEAGQAAADLVAIRSDIGGLVGNAR